MYKKANRKSQKLLTFWKGREYLSSVPISLKLMGNSSKGMIFPANTCLHVHSGPLFWERIPFESNFFPFELASHLERAQILGQLHWNWQPEFTCVFFHSSPLGLKSLLRTFMEIWKYFLALAPRSMNIRFWQASVSHGIMKSSFYSILFYFIFYVIDHLSFSQESKSNCLSFRSSPISLFVCFFFFFFFLLQKKGVG